jgi:type I site-specific restriction endonuclease
MRAGRVVRQFTLHSKNNIGPELLTQPKRGRQKEIISTNTIIETAHRPTVTETTMQFATKPPKTANNATKPSYISRLFLPTASSTTHPLRPYQEECVDACLKAISEGNRRFGVRLATGTGKTVIFTDLIGKVLLAETKRYQTIILAHRRELVEQAAGHCVQVYPDKVPPPPLSLS